MRAAKTVIAILVVISAAFVTETTAQTQTPQTEQPEKIVKGEVKSIDPAGTSITLRDGTELVTPPGVTLRPGALAEGTAIIASYLEENGAKILTALALDEASASPPADRRFPTKPSPAPPR